MSTLIALLVALQQAPTLGMDSRAPTAEEAPKFKLREKVQRWQGQVVLAVEEGGPAAAAGLKEGDVILQLDENKLYSRDDLDDFVATSKVGARVTALVKRASTFKEERLAVVVGGRAIPAEEARKPRFTWDFAGPAQLEAALKEAAKSRKKLLVGLSGAET